MTGYPTLRDECSEGHEELVTAELELGALSSRGSEKAAEET